MSKSQRTGNRNGRAAQTTQQRQKRDSLTLKEWVSRVYVVMMLGVFPLYLHPDKYVLLTQHKANFFFIATCTYLLLSAVACALPESKRSIKNSPRTLFDWALAAYLFISVLSALFSPYPENVFWGTSERYDGLLTILLYGGAFFVLSHTYRYRAADMRLFAVSAGLVSVIGILQYYGADIFSLFPYERFPGSTGKTIIFRTTLGNIDIVSAYTAVTSIFFGILFVKTDGKSRFLYLAAGALSIYLMVLAGAQAGYLGVLCALVLAIPFLLCGHRSLVRALLLGTVYALSIFLFKAMDAPISLGSLFANKWLLASIVLLLATLLSYWIGKKFKPNWPEKTVRIIGITAMVLVIVLGFAVVEIAGRGATEGTLYEARSVLHGHLADEFGTYRGFIWNRTAAILREQTPAGQLLIGSGPDTFAERFMPYYGESYELLHIQYDKAHNEYLQILICQGILGLVFYLLFLGALFAAVLPRLFQQPLALACALACASYAIAAFFGINIPITTPIFWVLLGIMGGEGARSPAVSG